MATDHAREPAGASLPILSILIVVIAALFYVYGWTVLMMVVVAFFLITIGVAAFDKATHATRCRFCNKIKARLAEERGVDVRRITTAHVKDHADRMQVRCHIDQQEDILVTIDFNEQILDWPGGESIAGAAQLRPVQIGCMPSPSVPAELLIQDGSQTWLMFFAVSTAVDKSGHLTDLGVAALRCRDCVKTRFGYPNDEGLPEHPLFEHGLRAGGTRVVELVDSPWAAEIDGQVSRSAERIWGGRRMDHGSSRDDVLKHFIMPLKEATFECLASELKVEGFYGSFDAGLRDVVGKMREE